MKCLQVNKFSGDVFFTDLVLKRMPIEDKFNLGLYGI